MEKIKDLLEAPSAPAVSIYMPVSGIARDPVKLAAHLKGLLRDAETRLDEKDTGVLDSAKAMTGPRAPWRQDKKGVAFFLAPGFSEFRWLGYDPGTFLEIGDRFNLRPLLPVLEPRQQFYILSVDPVKSTLYVADRFDIEPIEGESFERSLAEIQEETELAADVGYHATGPAATTSGAATPKYHSLGDSPEDYKQVQLDEFVARLAKAVDTYLDGRDAPLVLVADPNLLGMCRKHVRYPGLLEDGVSKNPSGLEPDEILADAQEIAGPTIRAAREEAKDRLETVVGREGETAALDTSGIVAHAIHARVETLFADPAQPLWGRISSNNGELDVTVAGEIGRGMDDVDLISHAVVETLRNGGDVFGVERSELPGDGGPMRAVLRY